MDLEDADQHLLAMFKHVPMGVAIFEGPDLVYRKINAMLAELNGLPIEDHIGRRLIDVLPDAKDNLLPIMTKVLETGEPVTGRRFTMRLPKDPDTPIELIDYLFPIPGPDGQSVGIGALVIDVGARRRAWEDAHGKKAEDDDL